MSRGRSEAWPAEEAKPGQPRTTHRAALVELLLELVDALAVVSCGRREVADLKCSVSLSFIVCMF